MIVGGEGFPERLYGLLRLHSDCEIYNSYGPTEVTIASHQKKIESGKVSAGFPMLNVWDRITDENGKELPPNEIGELYVGGAGVARGYFRNEELTAERFPVIDGVRYCNTGDLAYKDENGEVFVLGRKDGMVKLRGFRIELGEVSNVLGSYENIADARALVRKVNGTDHLVVFYTLKTGAGDVSVNDLRKYMADRLPGYMVPTFFNRLESFPMTPNGKVSVKELEELPIDIGAAASLDPPQSETEKEIFKILGDVMGTDVFGIHDILFNMGLTSLSIISVLERIYDKFGDVPVTVRDIFGNPTVAALAEAVSEGKVRETFAMQEDYPLTQTQKGILVECLSDPGSVKYNISWLYRLSSEVDTERLKKAVESAIAAHPYLNASLYIDENGEYRVRRNDSAMPVVTIEKYDNPSAEVFDLTGERLYRAKILEGSNGNSLLLEFHHIIYDGTSERIFLEDVNAAYDGSEPERETYTGFEAALEEEKIRKTDFYEKAKDYYSSMLSDLEQDMLPEGDAYGTDESTDRFTYDSGLEPDTIKAFCREHGITENAFFNSIFSFVLARFTGQDKAVYTTVYNGRNDAHLLRAVSMFVKTFPVVSPVDYEQNISDFMKSVQEQLGNNMRYDIFSFAEISHTYGISADILFIYQGEGYSVSSIGGKPVEACSLMKGEAKAPITIEVVEEENSIQFECEFRSDIFTDSYMKSMAACLKKAAEEFMQKKRLADVSLLDEEAAARLDDFNRTEVPYDKSQTVVSLFRKSAAENKERTAVIFNDIKISYERLDELSEKIAAFIADSGLGCGNVVSVLIHRSEYMPIASLGILKAGCAYQPLDPTYPEERLSFMVEDSGASLLITTRELRSRIAGYKGEVLFIEDIPSLPAPKEQVSADVRPDDTFILLYTSGSTGVPKGVKLTHGNIVCFSQWYIRYYDLTCDCKVGAYASYGFDAHMMDTYPALFAGATEVIIGEDIRLDLAAMNEYMEKNHVTHVFMTTQVGRQFAINIENHTLKALTVGGEKLVPLNPPAYSMYNGYGPTECTVFTSIIEVEKKEKNIPIGRPLEM